MIKEYRLEMQTFGESEREAIERAIAMLNQGASFDQVTYLYDSSLRSQQHRDLGTDTPL